MLVMMFRTVTVIAAWRRCSTSVISSAVVPCAASRWCSQASAGVTAGSRSRSRWTSSTANAVTSRGLSPRDITAAIDRTPGAFRPRISSASASASLAYGAGADHRVRQPAQVLHQHHPQRDRDRPQFADGERLHALVRPHEPAQRVGIEPAVGVRHERPGDAVYPRVSGQRSVGERRQLPVESLRQVVADFAQLLVDDEEVVDQPFRGRGDPALLADRFADDPVGLAQHAAVGVHPRQERALRFRRRW